MRVITNADDLGRSSEINRITFELMRDRLVTSATILANGPAAEDACLRAVDYAECSFGVHLNLTEFAPLSPGLAELLSAKGEFCPEIRESRELRRLRPEIRDEWSCQVTRVLAYGVRVSHIDSHHHVHTLPSLFPVVKQIQADFGIRRVRISRNLYSTSQDATRMLLLKKLMFREALRHMRTSATTDAFTDLSTFIERRGNLSRAIHTIEVGLHPGAGETEADETRLRALADVDSQFRRQLMSYWDL